MTSSEDINQYDGSTLFGGPISKWTNIIKGWQNRYLVLDQTAQTLCYYTSIENYMQGDGRGAIRLRGSVIGIDDDDDCMFSITTDDKAFHFQARNPEERERWIHAIQKVADSHQYLVEAINLCGGGAGNRQIAELDGYLLLLLNHMSNLEVRVNNTSGEERDNAVFVLKNAKRLTEAIKYAILSFQIQKAYKDEALEETLSTTDEVDSVSRVLNTDVIDIFQSSVPVKSYSSSEDDMSDDNFFDALDEQTGISIVHESCTISSSSMPHLKSSGFKYSFEVYDACYNDNDNDESETPVDCSIFTHLLSQVKLGMDLTRVTLPTFILERRSFLEMIADVMAHSQLFTSIPDADTPKLRFVNVIRWYLSTFHAGRRSVVPKKPYNPVLGEIFQCYYSFPNDENKLVVDDGPVPWAFRGDVSFIAEQVCHHPPVSAYYAECVEKQIEIEGWIWTKSRFLGLSVGVNMVGVTTLKLLNFDEEYSMTFPSAYGRSILSIPWFELGGKVFVECKQTGYRFDCEFLTKPFYGGKKHRLVGNIMGPDGRQVYMIDGQWNDKIHIMEGETESTLYDANNSLTISKTIKSIKDQKDNESRRLWRDVTYHLKHDHVDRATDAKRFLEDKQRKDASTRLEENTKWTPKLFETTSDTADGWTYINKLSSRN